MFEKLLASFAPLPSVQVARTAAEREGIYRLRYEVNVQEFGFRDYPSAEHARKRVRSPVDDQVTTTLLYIGTAGAPDATLRLQIWRPGAIPADAIATYSLERFPDVGTRTVGVVSAMCATKSARGSMEVVALTSYAVELGVGEHGVEILFAECPPGQLRAYRHLGLRPYGGRPVELGGLAVPVVAITGDLDHLRRVGSPWLPVLKALARKGQVPTGDYLPLVDVVEGGGGMEVEPERVTAEVESALRDEEQQFLARLSDGARGRLVRSGSIREVQPDVVVLAEGIANREMFVVLDGVYEVEHRERHVRTLGPGDAFGEVAFFHGGYRTATVRSRSGGRLLMLRPEALEELAKHHPLDVIEIYRALAAVLAERLAAAREGR